MNEKLTIVIPSKNEGSVLYQCIENISLQYGILGTRVIISDSSDEIESVYWMERVIQDFGQKLNIEFVQGGYPSEARLNGSKLVKTPYILFIDSDIMLYDRTVIYETLEYSSPLVSTTITTERGWNWVYKFFNISQKISILLKSPFAVGAYQLWNTDYYWKCGGYNPEHLFAEDYYLSSRSSTLIIHPTPGVWTGARRFKSKGIKWMFIMMLKSYKNRNNPDFFKNHHQYWT